MKIEHNGISFTPDAVHIDGRVISWLEFERVLEGLYEVVQKRRGWFPIAGPPSNCLMAIDEIQEILKALFEKETP